jgi:hypothetical protein
MVTRRAGSLAVFAVLGVLALAPNSGCSSSSKGAGGSDTNGDGGGSSDDGGCVGFSCTGDDSGTGSTAPTATCANGTNWKCSQVSCPSNGTTTLHGTVFDPAGSHPLNNVAVYVPNTTPNDDNIPDGVMCGNCDSWYTDPVVSAVTDPGGNFTITNMPVGANVPLVVQVGKWRMVYTLSNVSQCKDNDAATLVPGGMLRLPRNHTEGHIPNIAISTGQLDSLECLIRRMGIDASEYTGVPTTSPNSPRIHIFTGGDSANGAGGAQTQGPQSKQSYQYLWDKPADMEQFDVVLLSCEGRPTSFLGAGPEVMNSYVNAGGRVFASHYHYAWFTPMGPFSTVTPPLATWTPEGTGTKTEAPGSMGDPGPYYASVVTTLLSNNMTFPEGASLHTWLGNVGALTNDKLPIYYARYNADVTATNTESQTWIKLNDPNADMVKPTNAEYFSFDTPIGTPPGEQCGRVVYSDLHVSGGIGASIPKVAPDYPGLPITPSGCAAHPLTPQELALEFMIFDLSSCLTPVGQPMMPPPPK